MTGIANVEETSSPYAGGLPDWVTGLWESSRVILLLSPDGTDPDMVSLRSFFSFFVTCEVSSPYSSATFFLRPGSRTLDFFFVNRGWLKSMVGAVVTIAGARDLL